MTIDWQVPSGGQPKGQAPPGSLTKSSVGASTTKYATVITGVATDSESWDTLEHDATAVAVMSAVLSGWDPFISAGRRQWTIWLSVAAASQDQAVAIALKLIEDAGSQCGWPLWKVSASSAHEIEGFERELRELALARHGSLSSCLEAELRIRTHWTLIKSGLYGRGVPSQ